MACSKAIFPVLAAAVLWAGAVSARENVIVSARENGTVSNRGDAADVARVTAAWPDARSATVAALADLGGTDLVVYYSGPVQRHEGSVALPDGAKGLEVRGWLQGHAARVVLIVNTCGTNMNVAPQDFAGQNAAGQGGWLAVFPANGSACVAEDFADSVLVAMQGAPEDWPARLRAARLGVVESAPADGAAPAALATVQNDSILITTLRPVNAGPRVTAQDLTPQTIAARPADIPQAAPALAMVDGSAGRGVIAPRAGLPEPSIIVGEQAIPRPQVQRNAMGVAFDQRNRIRSDDPAIFARMVEEGAFDPDEAQIAAAIQTELQRMNCYAAAVDGLWGGGSNAAVQRYFGKAGGTAAGSGPQLALYRQIILNPDVTCDTPPTAAPSTTPAVAAPRGGSRPAATAQGSRPRAGTATARPAATTPNRPRAQQQQQAPSASGGPRISPNLSGAGMFR